MFNFFKKIFKKNNKNDLYKGGKLVEKSSIVHSKNKERFLKLDKDTCAIVLHPKNNVEIVFTELYDPQNQTITPNEEALMALGLFIKQPGFLDMLIKEFHRIAMENVTKLTSNVEKDNKENK